MSATMQSRTRGSWSKQAFWKSPDVRDSLQFLLLLALSLSFLSLTAHAKKVKYVITAYVVPAKYGPDIGPGCRRQVDAH